MARLEQIYFIPHRCKIVDSLLEWSPLHNNQAIKNLPQIIWKNSTPWREANLWLMERASSSGVNIKTVQANASALNAYANWLELTETDWFDFPVRKADRCLIRYRGALINARNNGEIAPSTASERMASVVRFYRWLNSNGLISPNWPMWQEKQFGFRLTDKVGFERTISISTTDLSISNRRAPGERLEDGLLPLSKNDSDVILKFTQKHASEELFLMLTLGFYTGMRLGTLTDLKVQTLERAASDPSTPELFKLAVGPGADPPVHTKFGVTGHVWITRNHLNELLNYTYSIRRLKRQAKAAPESRDLLFLTSFGNPYTRSGDKSSAINVEIHSLRKLAALDKIVAFRNFHFHQTRCTFATNLAKIAIRAGNSINAIAIVKEALLHKHESTSLKYIKFVEHTPTKIEAANAFTRDFLGVLNGRVPQNE